LKETFYIRHIKTQIAMVKINQLKSGDLVMINDEGIVREGTVVDISHEDNQALINNGSGVLV
jgi:uncharacterized protein YijF (DUF1287 family)